MKEARVKEAMNEAVVKAGEDEPLNELARMMKRHRTNRLHIVDDQGKITGIVTRSDILLGLSKKS